MPNRLRSRRKRGNRSESVSQIGTVQSRSESASLADSKHQFAEVEQLIAELAVEIWRLERRLSRLVTSIGEENARPLRESLRRLNDLMLEHRLDLRLHDGERYTEGQQFEVIHIREQADPLFVVETIRPSVIMEGRVIRQGQVVLGSAKSKEEESR